MAKHGKKYRKATEDVQADTVLPIAGALEKVREVAFAKFDESVDADVNLGIDASKGEQTVRGSVVLPHGRGREVRVVVFAKGDHAEEAQKAGADFVGTDDLVQKIKGGWLGFDHAVATPDVMGLVGSLAKVLGPRGLLPNKKVGTVTFDVGTVVEDLKRGKAFFRNDKAGIVHFSFGKVSFDAQKLQENLAAFIKALAQAKPPSSKGKFLKKMSVSSTMGPGFSVNPEELLGSV